MSKRKRYMLFSFNDRAALVLCFSIVGFAVIQSLKVLTALALIIFVIAAVCFWFRWHLDKRRKEEMLRSSINEIDSMKGTDFERYLGLLFENIGYTVKFTPATGDYGADLLLRKGRRSIAVQAKRYKNSVGISSVQQIHAARSYYKVTEAWVVTNNNFTKNAYNLAEKNGVTLVDRNELINLILKSNTEISSAT